jgi:sugar lactone lactonase YvrE
VRAYKSSNSAVTTDYSNEIVVANFICPYPEPTNLAAALDCPDVRLEWDGIPTASGYAVYRSLVSGGPYTQISSGVSSPYTDAAVVEGETYHYVVTAYYSGMAGEESAYSNEASMTVACSTVVQPSNLVAAVNCPDVELTWDAAAPAEYDRYTVSRAPASGGPYAQIATGIETLSYIDLDPGDGTYYYIVNAYKSGDPGYQTPASNEAAAVIACAPTPTVPKPPHPVNSTPVTGGITLEWTPPTENTDGTPLTDLAGYKVYRKTMPGGDYAWAQDLGSQTSWTDTSVTPGSEYCYVMTAVDSEIPANESAYSVETCGAPEGNIPYTYAFQCGNDIPPHFGAPTPEGELYVPYEATVDDEGNIYVTNKGNSRIEKYDANCNFIMKFGSTGSQPGKFGEPEGIVFNPANQLLYITDKYNRIQAFNKNGIYQFNWASNKTRSVAIDAAGGIYSITRISVGQEKVIQYTSAGAIISEWAAPGAQAAAIDASGRVYVTNAQQKRVDIYSGGALIGNFGTGLLDSPYGIHISPDGRVFVADSGAGNIQIFAPDGSHIDTVGESGFDVGQFTSPTDIWVVSNDRIIVVDNQHDRIQALIRE